MAKERVQRINSQFGKAIYEIISTRIKDENITEMYSILKTEVTSDLKYAKVYVSVYSTSEEKRMKTFDAIASNAKQIRRHLASMTSTRTVPELTFILDDSFEYSDRINKILEEIKKS